MVIPTTSKSTRRTQQERRQSTRAALVHAARGLFAERGFSDTRLDDVVRKAGVTRGALYHHFETKTDLFRAVIDRVDEEFLVEIVAVVQDDASPVEWIKQAGRAYIQIGSRTANSRLAADTPSVLGLQAYREISAARCQPIAELAGQAAADAGVDLPGPVDTLAALILGALVEGAFVVAANPDSEPRVLAAVDGLLDRVLQIPDPH